MIGISSEKWSGKLGEVPRRVKHHTSTSSSRGSFRAKVPISSRKAYISGQIIATSHDLTPKR